MSEPIKPVQNPLTLVMTMKSPEDAAQIVALVNGLQGKPPEENPIVIALNRIRTVHFARFVFLDNNTKLAVITTYDGSFEKYINAFVDNIGQIFDALLAHMEDAPPLPVEEHRKEFLAYVRKYDLPIVGTYYSAYPEATVLTIDAALEDAC
jgi:hypothetical protein